MASNNSSQKFIARNRAPRVQIGYEVETCGSEKNIELSFFRGVLADLAGQVLPPVAEHKFLELDNFDERMKAIRPRVAFPSHFQLEGLTVSPRLTAKPSSIKDAA